MASNKPKTELVAICKLEFYRKQKNWRYCPPEPQGKDPKRRTKTTTKRTNTKDSKAELNRTYNIALAPKAPEAPEKQEPSGLDIQETEERHILDEAFVDTDTGIESDEAVQREDQESNALEDVADKPSSQPDPPGSPYSPKWSIQRWAERHGLWNPEPSPTSDPIWPTHDPIGVTHDPTCPTYTATCPTLKPLCPVHNPTFPQQTSPREDANCHTFDNNYNIIQDVYYSNQHLNLPHKGTDYANYTTRSCDAKYARDPFDSKSGVSMVYYNSNMYHQNLDLPQIGTSLLDVGEVCEWDADADGWGRCAGEGAVWSDAAWLQEMAAAGAGGEDAPDGDWQLHDLSAVSACSSLPSAASGDFLRGAALAPHSTEIDLLVGAESAPARLPPGELAPARLPPGELAPARLPPGELAPARLPPGELAPARLPPGELAPARLPPGELAPARLPPGELAPARLPPGELAPARLPPGELAPARLPPGELAPARLPPGELAPARLPPGELAPARLPPGELAPARLPPGELAPARLPPGELAPARLPPGELAPARLPPGELAPARLPPGELAPARLPPGELAAAHLPADELAAAVARHSAALRALLAEAMRRDQMPSEPPQPPSPLYEVPVRDPGPTPAPALFRDRVVARSRPAPALRGHTGSAGHIGPAGHSGSGAGLTEAGKGRGRLKIGIRMGRPYRL